jgi:hypothetical protein
MDELKINITSLGLGILLLGFAISFYFFKNAPSLQHIAVVNGTLKSIVDQGKGFVGIKINERDNRFEIKPYVASHFDLTDFESIQKPGDKIEISINKSDVSELGHDSKIEIIGLRCGTREYLTLNDYEAGLAKDKNFVWSFVLSGLYLVYLGFKNESAESQKNGIVIGLIFLISIVLAKLA